MSGQAEVPGAQRRPRVDVVIPVLNEAHVLEKSVDTLTRFLESQPGFEWRIVVVDNGSTDGTDRVARALASQRPNVAFLHLEQRGRGRALRYAWQQSTADVACYMDVDLSTDLRFLPELVGAIAFEGYDVATGSRLAPGSKTRRGLKREVISRIYNLFLRWVLDVHFSDAQCGFKAVGRRAIEIIVPQIQDQAWFFDTELLVLAERQGFRIKDIPVVWVEDDDSRVKIISTAWEDIKGVFRLRRQFASSGAAQVQVVGPKNKPRG